MLRSLVGSEMCIRDSIEEQSCADSEGLAELLAALTHNHAVKSLNLSSSPLLAATLPPLCELLSEHPSLVTLDVSCTNLADRGFTQLAAALCGRRSLTSLAIGGNSLTNASAKSLSAVLDKCPIKALMLGARHMDSYALCPAHLDPEAADDLSQMSRQICEEAQANGRVATAPSDMTQLPTISNEHEGGMNVLSESGAAILSRSLRASSTLEHLELVGMPLDAGSYQEILLACAGRPEMRSVQMSCWWGGEALAPLQELWAGITALMQSQCESLLLWPVEVGDFEIDETSTAAEEEEAQWGEADAEERRRHCLLYTSDAADEEDSVDLGGRLLIKKKKIDTVVK
eukprot:TRINITY_DN32437_c0_g1_i1.p1 TRINITY_DN32437_c0_g1~~TRINITY_DN32437_c0_g1_i1.p1  ORF type:complete len:344 (+),score=114.55 TRINITY_DN32437_c0_g1_i1:90-1121(+)